ncbi:MAG: hypothetical protein WCI31_01120 [Prolixibacteraceae bacterium]
MKDKIVHSKDEPLFPKMESGFTVPEGYFESFGERLNRRMEEVPRATRSINMLHFLKPALGLAAGLALLLTLYLHPFISQKQAVVIGVENATDLSVIEETDPMLNTYSSMISDGQFITALSEMDEYDASKISKDGLAEYLVSNCSDFEILNANK